MMNVLSTGQPSTLGTYKKLASIIGDKAVAYIQKLIDESPNGEDEEVIADERQMLFLLSGIEWGTEEITIEPVADNREVENHG